MVSNISAKALNRSEAGECPLREVARTMSSPRFKRRVKKNMAKIYLALFIDVFSNTCWKG